MVVDGSGLSPRNRISAATLVEIIRSASSRFGSGPEFLASLPLGGLDGTLEDRMEAGDVPVRAKTGHLRRVASLSGLVPTPSGQVVFSVLINGARGSDAEVDVALDGFIQKLVRAEFVALSAESRQVASP